MIEKVAYTWQDIVDAYTNNGVQYNDSVTVKLMKDIDCNDEIPEGVETTLVPNLSANNTTNVFVLDGGYEVNGEVRNHVIRNLRTHILNPVTIFMTHTGGGSMKNIDFINVICDGAPLFGIRNNVNAKKASVVNCRFVGRRTYNLWNNTISSKTYAGFDLYSCFFNVPYIKSPYVAANVPLERNTATGSNLKYYSYAYFCRFVESHNSNTGITSCNNLKLSGCRIQGELTSSSPITITSQYDYDSLIQNVVDLTLKTTAEQGTTVVVNAPKGVWKDAIYSTDSTILSPYQYTNTNPLAIPESPADMKNVSELYSDGFDVQQPNPNSVGGNNG